LNKAAGSEIPGIFRTAVPDEIRAGFVLFATGRKPADGFIARELMEMRGVLEERGRLVPAGDVRGGMCRQVAISAGDGLRAAMMLTRSRRKQS
jgi:thioredoxin reductase